MRGLEIRKLTNHRTGKLIDCSSLICEHQTFCLKFSMLKVSFELTSILKHKLNFQIHKSLNIFYIFFDFGNVTSHENISNNLHVKLKAHFASHKIFFLNLLQFSRGPVTLMKLIFFWKFDYYLELVTFVIKLRK